MSTIIKASPAQLGGTVCQFPEGAGKLIIRVESGGTFKVHIKVGSDDPSATAADIFLDSGEAYEFDYPKGSGIRILNITGDPKIFWAFR